MKHARLVLFLFLVGTRVQAQVTQPQTGASFFSFPTNFWTVLSFLLLAGIAVYLVWMVRLKLDRYGHEIESLKTRFSAHLVKAQQSGTNEIKKQVEMLVDNHPKWGEAQQDLNALISRLEVLETAQQKTAPLPEVSLKKEKRPQPIQPETFYMTFPVGNYFPITAKSESRDNTIYKFRVRPNKTEADFEVHTSGASMQELIGLVQTYIKPACDEENMPSPQARNIVTSLPGLALLEGDKWIIKKKALIRYE